MMSGTLIAIIAANAVTGPAVQSRGNTMHQMQGQRDGIVEDLALVDRVEDALLSVNPDLWLVALLLVVGISWIGRLA